MRRLVYLLLSLLSAQALAGADARPNFLFILTDDQSWQHTSYAGFPAIKTPAFDRIASEGVYFKNAFASAPTCTASRSAILSGQHFWQTNSGATLWGAYPEKMPNFIHQLAANGYVTAYTGKGWGPGAIPDGVEPTGKYISGTLSRTKASDGYVGVKGYAKGFETFLNHRDKSKPFFFWAGFFEPHRDYLTDKDDNRFKNNQQAAMWPVVLPFAGRAQKQFTLYLEEIEYADKEAAKMLSLLEQQGLLDNTIIIYTSDNGMPFAGAKSNLYRYGVQVPLAISWQGHHGKIKKDSDELVSLIDIAPTVLDLAKVPALPDFAGQSLSPLFGDNTLAQQPWQARDFVLTGFERHSPDARPDYSTYPMRGIITRDWFFIHNYQFSRWPQGEPTKYMDAFTAHLFTYKGRAIEPYFTDFTGKRPERELYRWDDLPGAVNNKVNNPEYVKQAAELDQKLEASLITNHDPGNKDRDYFFKTYGKLVTRAAPEEKEADTEF